jgi:hypothetical protein
MHDACVVGTKLERANKPGAVGRDRDDKRSEQVAGVGRYCERRSIETTRSGVPSCQPPVNAGIDGNVARLPSGAPSAIQRCNRASSSSGRRRASLNVPCPGSGFHGGINRRAVTVAINSARRRTSS